MPRSAAAPAIIAALTLSLAAPRPSLAAWTHNPGVNLPVCTAVGEQSVPTIVADGAGGAFVAWHDRRGGIDYDIYAQHVLSTGAVDPLWPAGGRAICTLSGDQRFPTIAADGAGGAIITWQDRRAVADYDIYAQHLLGSGAVDPLWPVGGRALCTAVNNQQIPTIVADGVGGAIVTWYDLRGGATYDIYAQRVMANGAVDPAWPADGRALCTAANNQTNPTIAADGAGGAIVTWYDLRGGVTNDIYAQHVLSGGGVDPAWPANGRALCTAANHQFNPAIVADGVGGAIVTWYDLRGGATYDIYAQHVLATGAVDASWPIDGRGLCTAANSQISPTIAADGAGGAIVTWQDLRSASFYDIYAQHVQASGVVDPGWPADGRALCTAASDQTRPMIAADSTGGAIVTWNDLRSVTSIDAYAQHVMATGAVDPAWPADGRALSIAASDQQLPVLVADGKGGAIVSWTDSRAGDFDIYAQRVARFGYLGTPEPEITGVRDIPNDQGGKVKLSWAASWLDWESSPPVVTSYRVYRSAAPNAPGDAARPDRNASTADPRERELLAQLDQATGYAWEYLAYVSAQNLDFITSYSYIAPTLSDSTGAYNPGTAFLVAAFDAYGALYWPSAPDSGYSVDNLAPATPAPFTGNYAAGATHLHWNPNQEPDLDHYRLYRGSSASFVPGPGNLVASPPDTGYADSGDAVSYYKLSAVDLHGNESAFALLTPPGTTGVEITSPTLALARPSPNPAREEAVLGYALPREMRVSLAILDLAGRRVRTLVEGVMPAGSHPVRWDLRAENGARAASGLYFVRLEADGRRIARRLAVSR